MTDPNFIESTLSTRTNADMSSKEFTNNRYHYRLWFDHTTGFDWIDTQVSKTSANIEETLELYQFWAEDSLCVVEIREIERRDMPDENQCTLHTFE